MKAFAQYVGDDDFGGWAGETRVKNIDIECTVTGTRLDSQ